MAAAMRSSARYALLVLLVSLPAPGQVKIVRDGDRITVVVQGKPFTALYDDLVVRGGTERIGSCR